VLGAVATGTTKVGGTVDGRFEASMMMTDGDPGIVTIWFLGTLNPTETGTMTGLDQNDGTLNGVGCKATEHLWSTEAGTITNVLMAYPGATKLFKTEVGR
jgi:hypothetical protein